MDTVVWAALAVAGLLAGIGIGFWLGRLQNDGDRVAELETELDTYKAQVTEHFAQSATHFQAIGRQYRDLYEHMAAGSQALCAPDAVGTVSFPAPAEVSALAEPAEPVEPPVEAAAAATDVEESEIIETTPYETEVLAEEADVATEVIEPVADEAAEQVAVDESVETNLEASAEATDDAVASESKADGESEVPTDTIAEKREEPEKHLYH